MEGDVAAAPRRFKVGGGGCPLSGARLLSNVCRRRTEPAGARGFPPSGESRQGSRPWPAAFSSRAPLRLKCPEEFAVTPFFVQIKCQLGKSYEVANALADAEIASEIYSTAGDFDLLVKFYVPDATDIGHFVNEKVQKLPGIQDTRTIITFKAF
ncbi:putative transcriptional regulator [Azorhizobium caulinodans ORS 571]|uniref:Putative transcriptional regulator n=1 Tax=Azorhizobium caulinodans (strain ATCC 43989 / DSM 5975 / JCM 20966 / LMG 6465 / NBRC 14845 / NCIMB 13405 / ORS 571) TaxID=438753 RepID=A8I566_AZOC5|nr:putative transcriptional regulator [Azorhizobium caulinodans ORS 571]